MSNQDVAQTYPEFAAAREAGHSWNGSAELFTWPILHLWEFRKPTISAVHGYAIGGGSYFALIPDIVIAAENAYFQMPLVQGLGFPGGETTIEPWVMMNYHRAYEYLYLAQTVDANEAHRLGMVNRVVPLDELDDVAELTARQIAQAPLTTLMGVKAIVKRAWEGMGMRTHLQQSVEVMELVGHSGDVAAWRQRNADNGYGPGPRQIAQAHMKVAEETFRATRADHES
jgi:enoyl-CoA hydratase/carnithine racemase